MGTSVGLVRPHSHPSHDALLQPPARTKLQVECQLEVACDEREGDNRNWGEAGRRLQTNWGFWIDARNRGVVDKQDVGHAMMHLSAQNHAHRAREGSWQYLVESTTASSESCADAGAGSVGTRSPSVCWRALGGSLVKWKRVADEGVWGECRCGSGEARRRRRGNAFNRFGQRAKEENSKEDAPMTIHHKSPFYFRLVSSMAFRTAEDRGRGAHVPVLSAVLVNENVEVSEAPWQYTRKHISALRASEQADRIAIIGCMRERSSCSGGEYEYAPRSWGTSGNEPGYNARQAPIEARRELMAQSLRALAEWREGQRVRKVIAIGSKAVSFVPGRPSGETTPL
ncbi:hypothetical protein OF83DRAFT_1088592 [Amylostereum chailletii]|nr:hypothetical protein OF83DRAFT_1088592 [Amylostereum chailletii]